MDVDHIKELDDQPARTFSAGNFRLAPSRENRVVLSKIHTQDPHQPDLRRTSGRGTSRAGKLTGPHASLLISHDERGLHEAAAADVLDAIDGALRCIDEAGPEDVF